MTSTINELKACFPNKGRVEWIGVRRARDLPVEHLSNAYLKQGYGIEGDRASRKYGGKRQVTLFQAEYLSVLATLHPSYSIHYADLRRNIAVSGLNLNILVQQSISIGEAVLEITGLCHPCSKMESQLGAGAYNALRGHGGLTAKVVSSGVIKLADQVEVILSQQT